MNWLDAQEIINAFGDWAALAVAFVIFIETAFIFTSFLPGDSLLFLTGLESDLDELVAVGAQATTVAVAGVVLPFALGTAGLYFLFHVPLIPAVFAGAAMTATSIGKAFSHSFCKTTTLIGAFPPLTALMTNIAIFSHPFGYRTSSVDI